MKTQFRKEHDFLGERELPDNVYYGIQTLRAKENFDITGIPEAVNQTCYYVIGADLTVTMAAEAGQLQLDVMEPVISFSLFTSLLFLGRACNMLREKCVDGITTNPERTKEMVMNSIGIVTQLNPILGYEVSAGIAKEAMQTGKSVYQIVVEERKLISEGKWCEIYSMENLINPKFINQ